VKYIGVPRRDGNVTVQDVSFPNVSGGAPIGHEMTEKIIRHDRLAWLGEQLRLPAGG
jgi:hypothetical protein